MTRDIGVDAEIDRIRIKEVASPATPASGYGFIYAKTDGLYFKGDNGTEIGPLAGSSSSGGAWTQVINESGASFTNFTAANGTWSSDGSVIKQTNTGITARAKFNTVVANSVFLFQTDVQIKTAGGVHAGLISGWSGADTTGAQYGGANPGDNKILIERDGQAELGYISYTLDVDTWYTIKILCSGGTVSMAIDGSWLLNAGNLGTNQDFRFVGLKTALCEAWFRNIKGWVLSDPA